MVKKDSLIKGTIILAAAALVARVLGLFQRIPLDYMMGTEGGIYFGVANNIYLMLLIIATGGIPSAISKMVSERYAVGRPDEAKRIYRAALVFGTVTGIVVAVLLFALAPVIATRISLEPGADMSIRAIAPALLLFPVIAMMRGYFQGRQLMMAGGLSQIVEQFLRVLTAVAFALLVVSWGWGDRYIAAAATFGSVTGSVGAFLIMLMYARKLRKADAAEAVSAARTAAAPASAPVSPGSNAVGTASVSVSPGSNAAGADGTGGTLSYRSIYKQIFTISVPIVIAAMTVQFIYNFDTAFFHRLTDSFYGSKASAQQVYDWLSIKAQALSGIPPILAIALSQSIIPVISSAYSVRNMDEVQRQTSLVMRIVVFTGVPIALMMTVGAVSLTGLLFESSGGSGTVAALTAGTIFQITMMTSNSVLFGMGKPRLPMRHTLAGIVVKIVASIVLSPFMGVYGLILSSTLCFVTIAWLNLRAIRREVPLAVLGRRWPGYGVTLLVAAGAGWLADMLVRGWLDMLPAKLTYLLAAAVSGIVALGLYLALLVLLRVVTPEDARQFPGPMRRLLGPLMRIAARSRAGSR